MLSPVQLQLVVVLQLGLRHLPDTQLRPVAHETVAEQSWLHCAVVVELEPLVVVKV